MPYSNTYENALAMIVQAHEQPNVDAAVRRLATVDNSLPPFLDFYENELNAINPGRFRFLDTSQKTEQVNQLLRIRFLIDSQRRIYQKKSLHDAYWVCEYYLFLLTQLTPEELNGLASPIKYLGLGLAGGLAAQVDEMSEGKVETLKNFVNDVNGKRFYWRYGGNLVNSAFILLSKPQGQNATQKFGIGTSYMSWLIYYTRLGLNLFLLLKNSVAGPWMSEEQKEIPGWTRFKTQWEQRKFILINDFTWATINLITFFWLVGTGSLGYAGNLTTSTMLIFDLVLLMWRRNQEKTAYNKKIFAINGQIDQLNSEAQRPQRDELVRMRTQIERDWAYQEAKISYDTVLSLGILMNFMLVASLLCPPLVIPGTIAMILTMSAGVLGFSLNLWYQQANDRIESKKTAQKVHDNTLKKTGLVAQFHEIDQKITRLKSDGLKLRETPLITQVDLHLELARIDHDIAAHNNFKKLIYLDIKDLETESTYQRQVLTHQRNMRIFAIFASAIVPPLVFVGLTFMPLGIGIGVIAAGLTLLFFAQMLLNRYAPKARPAASFDDVGYQAFAESLHSPNVNADQALPEPATAPAEALPAPPVDDRYEDDPNDPFAGDLTNVPRH